MYIYIYIFAYPGISKTVPQTWPQKDNRSWLHGRAASPTMTLICHICYWIPRVLYCNPTFRFRQLGFWNGQKALIVRFTGSGHDPCSIKVIKASVREITQPVRDFKSSNFGSRDLWAV